jgi:hypothetical protein
MKGRRLKVFQAHLGFYDTIVAAPSQKAALHAWGAGAAEFAKGFAQVTTDPAAVRSALASPGKALKRPFGSKGEYKLESDPVPARKLTQRQRKIATDAARPEKRETAARRNAERELKQAQQEEIREMAALKKREAELEKEKLAARENARKRIERARARLAGSSGR